MINAARSFTSVVGINHPIVQAPMAGGATTPELVAAVSNAGALGSFGAALLSPPAIVDAVAQIRALTRHPFNVNLFVFEAPTVTPDEITRVQALLAPIREALGIEAAPLSPILSPDVHAQIDAVLELAPPVVSFTFGLVSKAVVARFHRAGSVVIGTATTVTEAQAWEAVGADAICAQGAEAGGHRGTFLGDFEEATIGLFALVPQIAAAVTRPVIAAGGIMNGRGIAAALMLGAQAAQLGTAFLTCPETGIHPAWKQRIRDARADSTRVTRAFSGRPARGLVNTCMEHMRPFEDMLLPYPLQSALMSDIRQAAAQQNRPEFMSLWAGQAAALARPLPAAQLVQLLVDELRSALTSQEAGLDTS